MATLPLTFLEKKWAAGYGNNNLVTAATQTTDRKNVPMLDKDTHRSITPYGRRTLMTLGRWLYWNVSAVRGTIREMVNLTAQKWTPQFEGEDQAWGTMVENWLYEHDKICDVRGWPFNMAAYRRNLLRGVLIDGDVGTVLVKTATGYPMIQVIPAHRISSGIAENTIKGGPFDGARIIDGTILDDSGRVLGYRVWGENGETTSATYTDVPARDMFLSYRIETPDQIRGISNLGASCFDWQDVSDARRFELIAQKLIASIGIIETNETGEADRTQKVLTRSARNFDDTSNATKTHLSTTATETIDGVSIRYHRANSGSKIEAFSGDRPTANQQAFRDDVIREALHGIGWSFDFSYNPTKIGGAPMRVVVDRINREIETMREEIVDPAQMRVNGYRIASVMDNPQRSDKQIVLFPFNPDWYKWNSQGQARVTADAKYQSSVDIEERRAGLKTLSKSAAERGEYWKDVRAQNALEADDLLERAQIIAEKHGIAIELAISLLEKMDANPIQAAQPPEPPQNGSNADNSAEEPTQNASAAQALPAQALHFNLAGRRKFKIKRNDRGQLESIEDETE